MNAKPVFVLDPHASAPDIAEAINLRTERARALSIVAQSEAVNADILHPCLFALQGTIEEIDALFLSYRERNERE